MMHMVWLYEKEIVTSHTGCVSRNAPVLIRQKASTVVTSHTGCVSRNCTKICVRSVIMEVTSHTGCVSRNAAIIGFALGGSCHIPHGMCE